MTSLLGPRPPVTFAHESEAEIARLLDFYRIRWEYEPRSFPLEWGDDGQATLSFTPDFFLPDYDLFLEVTTVRPSLINRKNRKLRKLRERYPDINIKLLTLKDVEALFMKYGMGKEAEANGGGTGLAEAKKDLSEEGSSADFDADSPHASIASPAPTNLATHQVGLPRVEP
jgi:hypoxanthine phosphoribosyltransferase